MRIPNSGAYWQDRASDKLSSCNFQVFCTKMADIADEFTTGVGPSPRKQTKPETLAEGFRHAHNAQAATGLLGSKFIVSRSGAPLHLTSLPTSVLKSIPLPQEYEDELNPGGTAGAAPAQSGAFSGFGGGSSAPVVGAADKEARRLGMAAKLMFIGLGASLEVIYADEGGDLIVLEVIDIVKKPEAVMSMVDGIFDGGEPMEAGMDHFNISFGLLKEIK